MQGNWLYNDQETNWWKTKEKSKDDKFYPNIKSRCMERLLLMCGDPLADILIMLGITAATPIGFALMWSKRKSFKKVVKQ